MGELFDQWRDPAQSQADASQQAANRVRYYARVVSSQRTQPQWGVLRASGSRST